MYMFLKHPLSLRERVRERGPNSQMPCYYFLTQPFSLMINMQNILK